MPFFNLHFYYHVAPTPYKGGAFSFNVSTQPKFQTNSYVIINNGDPKRALLARVVKKVKSADYGLTITVDDVHDIRFLQRAVWQAMHPPATKAPAGSMLPIADDKAEAVKKIILERNSKITPEYFDRINKPLREETILQLTDAYSTGFGIFGMTLPPLQESQIIDFDIATTVANAKKHLGSLPDGKQFIKRSGRRLYIQKVDRTPIERCLGVDLIYNYFDEHRIVFVQYKCQRAGGSYSPLSDKSGLAELSRIKAIPGIETCYNFPATICDCRLCRCPAYFKLCKREIHRQQNEPVGIYFPACIWDKFVAERRVLSVATTPHLTNPQFVKMVRWGLIGSLVCVNASPSGERSGAALSPA